MKIRLLTVATRMPAWVAQGFETYVRRLPRDNRLLLEEVRRPREGEEGPARVRLEGERLLSRLKRPAQGAEFVIALDESGAAWRTAELAERMRQWRTEGCDVALLLGGADGLAGECRARADALWSLSALTLPQALVRVLVAEQIYRAWTVISGHPYHRS